MTYILPLFALLFIILCHEFGHFIVAKFNKIGVEEFAIGMGYKIFSVGANGVEIIYIKRNKESLVKFEISTKVMWKPLFTERMETPYSLRVLPIGGFCKIVGMNEETKDYPNSFHYKKTWQKLSVIIAGVLMNMILALIIFITLSFSGTNYTANIASSNEPLLNKGIEIGDTITRVNGTTIKTVEDYNYNIYVGFRNPNSNYIDISVKRDNNIYTYSLEKRDFLGFTDGIGFTFDKDTNRSFTNLISHGVKTCFAYTRITFDSFKQLFSSTFNSEDMSGIVGIYRLMGDSFEYGLEISIWSAIENIMILMGIVSINLAVINLLPIPVLDGGHVIRFLLEGLFNRRFSTKTINVFSYIGLFLIGSLAIFTTFNDVKNNFGHITGYIVLGLIFISILYVCLKYEDKKELEES